MGELTFRNIRHILDLSAQHLTNPIPRRPTPTPELFRIDFWFNSHLKRDCFETIPPRDRRETELFFQWVRFGNNAPATAPNCG
jgi:hypothetical protein